MNIRSLIANIDELLILLKTINHKLDIIVNNLNKSGFIHNSIYFRPIEKVELINIIKKCKDHSSFYEGSLTNKLIKNTSNNISIPLTILFNKCSSTGVFPLNYRKSVLLYHFIKILMLKTVQIIDR